MQCGKPVLRSLLVIFAITASHAQHAPEAADPERVGAQSSDIQGQDRRIERALENAYYSDAAIRTGKIEVSVADRIVTLTGVVETLAIKERAYRVAAAMAEVVDVVNRIAVMPAVEPPASQLREAVARALRLDPSTEAIQVKIDVDEAGRATLRGTVDSWAERQLAGAAAKSVVGIIAVRNMLKISEFPRRYDEEIAADVRRLLQWDGSLADASVEVSASDGIVYLSGTVANPRDKLRAITWAWQSGTREVRSDNLRVAEQ